MTFYHSKEGVSQYIEMAEGYDGRELIDVLGEYLEADASVLEIGMGPGVDLDILGSHFKATGSDYSELFLDRYASTHPDADLIQLDAITMETDRQFDAIWSNKVLHHLGEQELRKSVRRQHEILHSRGIVMHSFWYGEGSEEYSGMNFHYYDEDFLGSVFSPLFKVLRLERYTEMEENDSIFVLAMRTDDN